MTRRILVPLDGSPLAESILPSVVEFARLTGAHVTLVRVVEPATEDAGVREAEAAVQPYLAGVAERLATEGLTVDTLVLSGQAADQIIERAHDFDLIAMATHGRSGIGRWVYGSVADKVLRGAGTPVLLVRARADGPVATGHPRSILAPLDGSEVAEQALPLATAVAKAAGAELALVQSVFWVQMAGGGYPYGDGPVIQADEMLEQAEAGARAYLGEVEGRLKADGLNVRSVIRFDPAADSILSAAEEEQADLIVMSTHGRSGLGRWVLGSVADRVLRGATTPVLLVRAGTPADSEPR
jgi:nucleotide-binding universal stress UspA family protein